MGDEGGDALLKEWSSRVEQLIDEENNTEGAIKLLEDVIAKLESLGDADTSLTLAAALNDIGKLYANLGFSIKADSCFTRALLIKHRAQQQQPYSSSNLREEENSKRLSENLKEIAASEPSTSSDEDWEAIADQTPEPSRHSQVTVKVSKLSLNNQSQTSKQRGRGVFTYGQNALYSDQTSECTNKDKAMDESLDEGTDGIYTSGDLKYGTSHVLVVDGFSPKVSTRELEDMFKAFIGHGVVIRRINDTIALAVFRKPASACEALRIIHSQYNMRALDENDSLLSLLSDKDLEPPFPRPPTSARTAQRMIVGALRSQGLAKGLPVKSSFNDIQKQEEDRRDRILMRQRLRDEAWGTDD
jgi:tetratricopeptide (TPR) repeat protein